MTVGEVVSLSFWISNAHKYKIQAVAGFSVFYERLLNFSPIPETCLSQLVSGSYSNHDITLL